MQPPPLPVTASPEAERARVVPLRWPPAAALPTDATATGAFTIDLQARIDGLRAIRSDLEAYYWEHSDSGGRTPGERYQVGCWIRLVADRTATLEAILMHQGSTRVIVCHVTPEEDAALRNAATVLDQWIHEEEPLPVVLRIVAAVLGAADRIALRAAGGEPRPPDHDPDWP